MKQKLIILLILSLVLVGGANAEIPPNATSLSHEVNVLSGNYYNIVWEWAPGSGNVTNTYNFSINSGSWHNATVNPYYSFKVLRGSTNSIAIYAYNNTGNGNLSIGNITETFTTPKMFSGVTDTIKSVIPILGALQDLIVAVVPYILTLAIVGGLVVLIKELFSKGLNWR